MRTREVQVWSEVSIIALLGQPESVRLEFKSGALFEKPRDAWVDALTREISAFANSEGGTVLVGIMEVKRDKSRVAEDINGIGSAPPVEQIQQSLEGNVHPPLAGLRVRAVHLPSRDVKVLVIEVPQGSTAYQARDRRYYGRSEYEAKPLLHYDVYLRMLRGRAARAEAYVEKCGLDLTLSYSLGVRNTGERTLLAPILEIRERVDHQLLHTALRDGSGRPYKPAVERRVLEDTRLYPGDAVSRAIERTIAVKRIPNGSWTAPPPIPQELFVVEWRVFLDDARPSEGEIDVGAALSQVADQQTGRGA